jgi:sarcosine dehydrogenase
MLYNGEPIYRNGELVSKNINGAYAHLFGGAIGMGYLENPKGITDEWILAGEYEIDVEGQFYPAQVYLQPPHDPENKRVCM